MLGHQPPIALSILDLSQELRRFFAFAERFSAILRQNKFRPKISFAGRDFPSIVAVHRIRRVRGFVARPGRVFCRPKQEFLAALCFYNAHD
jgi:hypothetical protein